ncbi:hypothetical protein H9P43_003172 [Blastocladiella emersonii ATCC 22665]|nr:hypothetical protein H9P43_003172 [Blastocladiella emersonii ATCC 22665]
MNNLGAGLRDLHWIDPHSVRFTPSRELPGSITAARLVFSVDGEDFDFALAPWDGLHPTLHARVGRHYDLYSSASASQSATFLVHRRRRHDPLLEASPPLFEGRFTARGEHYHVVQGDRYAKLHRRGLDVSLENAAAVAGRRRPSSAALVVYRASDRRTPSNVTHQCGADDHHDGSTHAFPLSHTLPGAGLLRKRAPAGCPTSKKILYTSVAMDCTYIAKYGSVDAAQEQVLNNYLAVSAAYEAQFNIQVGILEIVPFATCNATGSGTFNVPCSANYTISNRLSDFSKWRGTRNAAAGIWHLYTGCATGSTIGLAWLNTACSTKVFSQSAADGTGTEYVTGAGVTASPSSFPSDSEWVVTAHEIGHNFGARHDCTIDTKCPTSGCCACGNTTSIADSTASCNLCPKSYIMNPYSRVDNRQFSPCSANEICSKYGTLGTCLADPGTRPVVSVAQCGNGIVEAGEECDCGGATACRGNACCNSNCTLKASAQCDDKSDACCSGCKLRTRESNTLCRPSRGVCDQPDFCDGQSRHCPPDAYYDNGMSCSLGAGASNGTCASGQCTTRDLQCKLRSQPSEGANATVVDEIEGECPSLFKGQCYLFCQSSAFGCRQLSGMFLDGTPCGSSGTCVQGVCSDADTLGKIIQWISTNVVAAAVIGAAVGILVLLALYKWCCCRCSGRRIAHNAVSAAHKSRPLTRREGVGSNEILMTEQTARRPSASTR